MIIVTFKFKEGLLTISGHSNRPEVCGGVSCLTGGLFVRCNAPQPKSGEFIYRCSPDPGHLAILGFVVASLTAMAVNYPTDLVVSES